MDAQVGDLETADILIEGERIVEIGHVIQTEADVIDARNMIVLPGFVDTHRHAWQSVLRHFAPNATVEEYGRDINRFSRRYRPEDVYAGTLSACLNAIDSGVTTLLSWSHISDTPEHSDADIAALRDSGIRGVFGYGQSRAGSSRSRYPEDVHRLKKEYFSSEDQLTTLFLGANLDRFKNWQLARDLGIGITSHIIPQWVMPLNDPSIRLPADTVDGLIRHAAAHNLLGPDITFIHCSGLSSDSWKIIADSGCAVSLSATSMAMFGVGAGIPPIQNALDVGIRPSLSLDTEVTLPGDFFSLIRTTLMFQRGLANEARINRADKIPSPLTARDVLRFATICGANANLLGNKVGSISVGKFADLILVRTDQINTMPLNNAYGTVVMGADRSNVDTVIISGKIRKWAGSLVDDVGHVRDLVARSQAHLYGDQELSADILGDGYGMIGNI